jgi:hypothetical protein
VYGNNNGTKSFAFRVDPDSATNSTRILQESVRITSALPEYHNREQRRSVAESMAGAGGKERSTILVLHQVLTGDERDVPVKKEFLGDLTSAIDERVPMEHVAMTVQDNERHRGGSSPTSSASPKASCSTKRPSTIVVTTINCIRRS